jgi:SAM-dependent methyltransferase
VIPADPIRSGRGADAPIVAAGPCRTTRTLDLRYLSRPPAASHRPYFGFVENVARDLLESGGEVSVLDVGCANGSFVHYLSVRHPHAVMIGMDALPELVDDATRNISGAIFVRGDIELPESLPPRRFSIVTMLTLHSHFDRLDAVLVNLLSLVEPGGRALVFGPFNRSRADVLVRIRADAEQEWQLGWNLHSRATVDELLSDLGVRGTYHDYRPNVQWPDQHDDPLRTRRALLDGELTLVNGAGLILPFALLEIRP